MVKKPSKSKGKQKENSAPYPRNSLRIVQLDALARCLADNHSQADFQRAVVLHDTMTPLDQSHIKGWILTNRPEAEVAIYDRITATRVFVEDALRPRTPPNPLLDTLTGSISLATPTPSRIAKSQSAAGATAQGLSLGSASALISGRGAASTPLSPSVSRTPVGGGRSMTSAGGWDDVDSEMEDGSHDSSSDSGEPSGAPHGEGPGVTFEEAQALLATIRIF